MNNKQIITLIVVAVAAMAVGYFIGTGTSSSVKPESQITMKNQSDSLNYFLGLNWGYSVGEAPWEIDADLLASGLLQVLKDTSSFDLFVMAACLLMCSLMGKTLTLIWLGKVYRRITPSMVRARNMIMHLDLLKNWPEKRS